MLDSPQAFQLVTDSDLDSLKTIVVEALQDWGYQWLGTEHWFVDIDLASLNDLALFAPDDDNWFSLHNSEIDGMYYHLAPRMRRSIVGTMARGRGSKFGEDEELSPIEKQLLADSIRKQARNLLRALEVDISDASELSIKNCQSSEIQRLIKPMAGPIAISIRCKDQVMTVVIDSALIENILAKFRVTLACENEIHSREEAIKPVSVPVRVMLGEVTLPLHRLTNLNVGDVVRFNAKITEPLRIEVNGQVVGKAYLGQQKNKRAIQVTN
jgi:flagellar motor switch protein FliM